MRGIQGRSIAGGEAPRRHHYAIGLATVVGLVLLLGVLSAASAAPRGSGAQAATKPLFGLVPPVQHPAFAEAAAVVGPTCKQLGCKAVFVQPPKCDAQLQSSIIRDLITRGVAGIAVGACDPVSVGKTLAQIRKQKGPKFPIVTFDADCCKSVRTIQIGTPNFLLGKLQAQEINRLLPSGGRILNITGNLAMTNVQDRIRGMKATLRSNIKMDIAPAVGSSPDLIPSLIRDALTKNPDIKVINEQAGAGAVVAQSLDQQGKDIPVVANNAFKEILDWMRKGRIVYATVEHQGFMAELATRAMYHLYKGQKPTTDFFGVDVVGVRKSTINTYKAAQKREDVKLRRKFEAIWR